MRILWILPYSPWPTTSGGKTRQFHLLRTLAERGHRITVLAQAKTMPNEEERILLESTVERFIVLPRRPLRSWKTLLAALCSRYPLLTSINGFAPELSKTCAHLLEKSWDIVQIEHSYTFQPFEEIFLRRQQPFILTEHNVESELGAATYQRLPAWLRPMARFDQWRYRRWEKHILPRAARVVAVSNEDASQLTRISGRSVSVVVNGVNSAAFAGNNPDPASGRLLFVGNYEYAPNIDAVQWAVEKIMPELWNHCPDARLTICGYAMPSTWSERWPDPRLEWRGFVQDLGELQRQSTLFFAPLRHGGGSKLKVLEAMAGGLPLVSTQQGVSGLAVDDGVHYLGGENTEQLAKAAAQLIKNPSHAHNLGEAGRCYVRQHHDWQVAAQQLETIYSSLVSERQTA